MPPTPATCRGIETVPAMDSPSQVQRLAQLERPPGLPVMKQRWSGLGFFHWHVDPEVIAARLPQGLSVDTFDGKAWLGVVPFFMERVRPVGMPPLPWLSWFHELNLRTYVFDQQGRPGVWFFSLDSNQPLAVELARRLFNLPYEHADMSSSIDSSEIRYRSRRRNSPEPEAAFHYPVAKTPAPAAYGSLGWFLVERYLLFAADKKGRLFSGRVFHAPYKIESITHASCSKIPFMWSDFEVPTGEPNSSLVASPVDVTIYPLQQI